MIYSLDSNVPMNLSCSHTICKNVSTITIKQQILCPQCLKFTFDVQNISESRTVCKILYSKYNKNKKIESYNDRISILIRNINNRTFEIPVQPNDTIRKVKTIFYLH